MSQLKFAVLDFGVSHLTTRQIKERLPGIKRVGLVDQRLKELPALMGTAICPAHPGRSAASGGYQCGNPLQAPGICVFHGSL